ncbi:MAG: carboxypeptidase-like regulatory domain-containing protein, partial [Bacteroidales bacterium]|nr:carboxypeptidase-like regulatory domain-containing protein [Bacteroidales bacterium]
MKNLIVIFFMLLGVGKLSAQEAVPDSLYFFSGYTVNAIDSSAIPNSHIINLSKGTGTVSSVDGNFTLKVRDMDTLKFSCVGFHDSFLYINSSLLRPDLIITLKRDTILMDELRVS